MNIKTLYDGRRQYGKPAHLPVESSYVVNGFLARYAFHSSLEREIDGHALEKAKRRRAFVQREAWKLANAYARVRDGDYLRARQKVETVIPKILVDEYLRALFGRDDLLNGVRENLSERQARRDVHVRRR